MNLKDLPKEEQAYRRGAHQVVAWLTFEIAVLDLTPAQFYEYLDRARDETRRMRRLAEIVVIYRQLAAKFLWLRMLPNLAASKGAAFTFMEHSPARPVLLAAADSVLLPAFCPMIASSSEALAAMPVSLLL